METKVAVEKFKEIQTHFRRLSNEMCSAVASYYIWKTLTFFRSIPEVGQEQADKNAELMRICQDFFLPTEQSHLQTFVITLLKFLDPKPPALSFVSLLKEIDNNKSILTAEVFRLVHPELDKIDTIKDDYSPIDQDILNEYEAFKSSHENLIKILKDARDKQFAHMDIKPIQISFIPNEVEILINSMQDMFNKISNTFDHSVTSWDHFKEGAERKTNFLLENFRRGEDLRREELKEKWLKQSR